MTFGAALDRQALDRRALLRRETVLSAIINAVASIGFFLLVFGWATVDIRSLAIDFLPQTFGITFLGGLVQSLLTLAKIRKRLVAPAGRVPTVAIQARHVLGCALIAMPVLGGSAALLALAFGPPTLPPLTALILKMLFGGLIGILTTRPILGKALGMPRGRGRSGTSTSMNS